MKDSNSLDNIEKVPCALLGRLLQGENTPDIFKSADDDDADTDVTSDDNDGKLLEVLNDIEADRKSEKLVRLADLRSGDKLDRFSDDLDQPLDGYYWLNLPPKEGYCIATSPERRQYRSGTTAYLSYELTLILSLVSSP